MTSARSTVRRTRRGAAAALLVVGTGLLLLLVVGCYVGLRSQRTAREAAHLAHTGALAVSLDHILRTIEIELGELADGRIVGAYFENASLGLSLEYGLRITLLDLEVELERRLGQRLPSGAPALERIVVLDADDRVVIDSHDPRRSFGRTWTESWPAPAASATRWSWDAEGFVVVLDCHLGSSVVGRLIGVVPVSTLYGEIALREQRAGESRLAWGRRYVPPEDDATNSAPSWWDEALSATPTDGREGAVLRVEESDTPFLVSSVSAAETSLAVVRATERTDPLLANPEVVLAALLLAAFLLEALAIAVWRSQVRTRTLAVELRKESEHARSMARQKAALEVEMERRHLVERELRLAMEVAESANRAKSLFLANMSHELRTPLNGILGLTEIVLESELTPEQRGHLESGLASGRSLLTLIEDVLEVAEIDSGVLQLEASPFDLREELSDLRRRFQLQAVAQGLELRWSVPPELAAFVVGDPMRIRQVLIHLLGNALKFTERGHVELELELVAADGVRQTVEFRVRDTGIGVPVGRRRDIFEAFQQADPSHTRRHGGAGLGLHLAARLVELMGGRIVLESEVGRGSAFSFRLDLPLAAIRAERPAA